MKELKRQSIHIIQELLQKLALITFQQIFYLNEH